MKSSDNCDDERNGMRLLLSEWQYKEIFFIHSLLNNFGHDSSAGSGSINLQIDL